ncbi:MAG: 2-oxoacid:acceptor oxidoreductase family protein [Deltaproteobacteria bacterium]|nr:2-oxoacid:acceptor oxidoreductase family protein [Deltaproteobacteria bacterium]
MSVFYEHFERHDHGQGLKAHATHYCPGCGHGVVHKFLGEAIESLGLQDDTVLVSPVGCTVFMYYYMDVGNTQAAHGRAPAVAIGHKLANPKATVIAYQGDGDLASIGLAEIFHAANLGLPITIIFVNNAIYGMTGGQMAPTTPMGLKTATSPMGRGRHEGMPMRMAELIAQLEAPIYVERVALFDNKQRVKAQKAITKALKLQTDRVGFSFVEVLAECPTHLKMTPLEAEKWVAEKMVPLYPLGVKKDVTPEAWPAWPQPSFDPERVARVVGGTTEDVPRFAKGSFPETGFGSDVALKLAGAGGDGAQTAALLLARAGIQEGFDATHIPSYGPESRGGTSYADVHVAATEVLSPAASTPHVLVAFNAPSLAKFGPTVVPGGVVLYDKTVITDPPSLPGVRMYGVPFAQIAQELGALVVKNIVALGALQAATGLLPKESLLLAIRQALEHKKHLFAVNAQAFERGVQAIEALRQKDVS